MEKITAFNPALAAPLASKSSTPTAAEYEAARKFEAAMLSPMVEEMLKTAGDEMMGAGKSAGLWQSFMAGAIAEQIVASGGIGVSEGVAQELAKRSAAPQEQAKSRA